MKKYIIPIQFIMVLVLVLLTLSGHAEQPKAKISNSLGMEFFIIEPGKFMMGSPENEPGRYAGEIPHTVKMPIWIK